MKNENKDFANSINNISDGVNNANNIVLDNANKINNWYSKNINEILENEINNKRLETNIEIKNKEDINDNQNIKIETKTSKYNEVQTNRKGKNNLKGNGRLKTKNDSKETIMEIKNNRISKLNKARKVTGGIKTGIKGVKSINNGVNKFVKTGKSINTGLNENEYKSFENISNRIMTKPLKKVTTKATSRVTREVKKQTKKIAKSSGKKIAKTTKKVATNSANIIMKIIEETTKMLLSMLPSIAPVIIIILVIAAIGNFFSFKSSKEADNMNFDDISEMMIEIDDEKLQAIYNEFLKNKGKTYLMDHSNLSYDECMETYDCSSWVIHCLAHTGIKVIPNTGATGIYNDYCNQINVDDRQAGDLIFMKDTYDTGIVGGISHVGIYMGELTINGEKAEWIIDTGGNPEGVKISKYDNGWWNGEHFYGFGRLKEEE